MPAESVGASASPRAIAGPGLHGHVHGEQREYHGVTVALSRCVHTVSPASGATNGGPIRACVRAIGQLCVKRSPPATSLVRWRLDPASAPRATRPAQGSLAADIEPCLRQDPDPLPVSSVRVSSLGVPPVHGRTPLVGPFELDYRSSCGHHRANRGTARAAGGESAWTDTMETGAFCWVSSAHRWPAAEEPGAIGTRGRMAPAAAVPEEFERPIGRAGTVAAARGCRPSDACVRDSRGSVCRSRFDTVSESPEGGIE